MKASILAVTISSLLSAQAIASTPKVDVELANSYTNQIINEQMDGINASVQAQLDAQYANATPGTTAVIDDVTYEKQSNGTWAAIGGASAALVAGLLSSSSSSSDNPNDGLPSLPTVGHPDQELPEYDGGWDNTAPSFSSPGMDARFYFEDGEFKSTETGKRVAYVDDRNNVVLIKEDGTRTKVGKVTHDVGNTQNDTIVSFNNGAELVVEKNDEGNAYAHTLTRANGDVYGWSADSGFYLKPIDGGWDLPATPDNDLPIVDGGWDLPVTPDNDLPEGDGGWDNIAPDFSSPNMNARFYFEDGEFKSTETGKRVAYVDDRNNVVLIKEDGTRTKVGKVTHDVGNTQNNTIVSFNNGAEVVIEKNDEGNAYSHTLIRANGDVYGWSADTGFYLKPIDGGWDLPATPDNDLPIVDGGWDLPVTPDNDLPEGDGGWDNIAPDFSSPNMNARFYFEDGEFKSTETGKRVAYVDDRNNVVLIKEDGTRTKVGKVTHDVGNTQNNTIVSFNNGAEVVIEKNDEGSAYSHTLIRANGDVYGWSADTGFYLKPIDGAWDYKPSIDNLPIFEADNSKNHVQITDVHQREGYEEHSGVVKVNGETVASIEFVEGSNTASVYTKNGIQEVEVYKVKDSENGVVVHLGGTNGTLVHIRTDGLVTVVGGSEVKSQLKSIDRNKLKNIDPAKLQRAKSAIQQRVRG